MRKMRNKEGVHSLIGFIALCQSRSSLVPQTKRGILRHPASVLAPGSALGSLPSVALSSAQAGLIIAKQESVCPKIVHAIGRADCRSWPITDPDDILFSTWKAFGLENHTCLFTGEGVKETVWDVGLPIGRFSGDYHWPLLK